MSTTISTTDLAKALISSYKLGHTEFSDMDTHIANCEAWGKLFTEEFYNEAVEIAVKELNLAENEQIWF